MSIQIPLSATMRGLALSSLLAPMAMAAQAVWMYGGDTDTLANFSGVSADSSQAITWMDNWASGGSINSNYYDSDAIQVNRPNQMGNGAGITLLGFDSTGLAAADVDSATLYMKQRSGSNTTWTIYGLTNGNTPWETPNTTWADLDTGSGSIDWTGTATTLQSAVNTSINYGTFSTTNTFGNDVVIPLTAALKAYLNGDIAGIAIANLSGTGFTAGASTTWVAESHQNPNAPLRPGLLVNVVPEAQTPLLIGLAGLLFAARRRRD